MPRNKCPECESNAICWQCGACQQCQLDDVDGSEADRIEEKNREEEAESEK